MLMQRAKHQDQQRSEESDFSEERIPFDAVLRKLVSTKPAHKAAKKAAKAVAKTAKKG